MLSYQELQSLDTHQAAFNTIIMLLSVPEISLIKCPKLSETKTQIAFPPAAHSHKMKCKMQRLKGIVQCTPQNWTHIYLSNQQTAVGQWHGESSVRLVQIKNTKLIPLTMPHAGTSRPTRDKRKRTRSWLGMGVESFSLNVLLD